MNDKYEIETLVYYTLAGDDDLAYLRHTPLRANELKYAFHSREEARTAADEWLDAITSQTLVETLPTKEGETSIVGFRAISHPDLDRAHLRYSLVRGTHSEARTRQTMEIDGQIWERWETSESTFVPIETRVHEIIVYIHEHKLPMARIRGGKHSKCL